MKYETIGYTNLQVSKIGIGGNIFGYLLDENQTKYLLDSAFDLGINFIDTADVYSNGLSETLISKAISGRRDKWIIASKVGIKSDEESNGLGGKSNIKDKVEKSLKRLNTDYIDLYQLHHYDSKTPLEETLSAFEDLISEGKILYAGCSNFNFEQLETSLSISSNQNLYGFSSIQLNYNLLKRNFEKNLLPLCLKHQIGVIVYGALGRGILSDKYLNVDTGKAAYIPRAQMSESIRKDITPELLALLSHLDGYAHEKFGSNLQTLAISWLLHQESLSSILLGMRSTVQLIENLNALELKLTEENINEIDELIGDYSVINSLSLGGFVN
ncbi:MAG: aldo/keto reductase [Candidatus Marinimicrobia bacterium]|nr:aldo/keto reductase [Candidatus Neomarinimicrobiota bacterium]